MYCSAPNSNRKIGVVLTPVDNVKKSANINRVHANASQSKSRRGSLGVEFRLELPRSGSEVEYHLAYSRHNVQT